jgi:hypothetical protein
MWREYWDRVWVLQELSAGTKETPIFCGRCVVSLEELFNAAIEWIHSLPMEMTHTLEAREQLSEDELMAGSIFDAVKKVRTDDRWITTGNLNLVRKFQDVRQSGHWPPLMEMLSGGRNLDATDPRDKIYGFMALTHP